MSRLEFTNQQISSSRRRRDSKPGGLTGFLLTRGLVRNRAQATLVLTGVALGALVFTVFVLLVSSGGSGATEDVAPPEAYVN